MSWHTGNISNVAGGMITVLDAVLPLNSSWSIYDGAAGTNAKVYKCEDAAENCLFYVYLGDNQADYSIIQLWQGWNATTHVGVGQSLTTINTYAMWFTKHAGGYAIALGSHRFIYIDLAQYMAFYIGQPKRYDTTKNIVIAVVNTTSTLHNNPLGFYNSGNTAGWSSLFDEGGNVNLLDPFGRLSSYLFIKTIAGTYFVYETPVYNNTTKLELGLLEGVMYLYNADNGLVNNDTITISGQSWIAIGGNESNKYWSLVKEA